MQKHIRLPFVALALSFTAHAALAQTPGTYGILTGDPNNKPVVTLEKTTKKHCKECGSVTGIKKVEEKAKGGALGAIAGGVGGGLLGHQVGKGRGKDVATVAGAVGGAAAGYEIERRIKDGKVHWDVMVAGDDKSTRELRFAEEPVFIAGDRVVMKYNR